MQVEQRRHTWEGAVGLGGKRTKTGGGQRQESSTANRPARWRERQTLRGNSQRFRDLRRDHSRTPGAVIERHDSSEIRYFCSHRSFNRRQWPD